MVSGLKKTVDGMDEVDRVHGLHIHAQAYAFAPTSLLFFFAFFFACFAV
jgi:hypothetical protein